jgi:hypothetical protein
MILDGNGKVAWRNLVACIAALPLCYKQQGDVVLKVHVKSIYSNCFTCFIGMSQVFHMDVAKVNQDVAYVAMAIYACCKCLFQMFHLFIRSMLHAFYVDAAYVSRICCIRYTHMLQVFYLDVAYACHGFQVFSGVLQVF